MFRCQICNTVVPSGTRSHKIIVQTREKTYAPRGSSREERGRRRFRGPVRRRQDYDKGGEGREIVRELIVCGECAEKHAPSPSE